MIKKYWWITLILLFILSSRVFAEFQENYPADGAPVAAAQLRENLDQLWQFSKKNFNPGMITGKSMEYTGGTACFGNKVYTMADSAADFSSFTAGTVVYVSIVESGGTATISKDIGAYNLQGIPLWTVTVNSTDVTIASDDRTLFQKRLGPESYNNISSIAAAALPTSGGTMTGAIRGAQPATFGNVSGTAFYGDGSHLTGISGGLPAGGTTGQALAKNSNTDYDVGWQNVGSTGTVTSVSVTTANGFSGTVSNPTTTPEITLNTDVNGLLFGNGTSISAAVAGTDYVTPNGSETLTNKTLIAPVIGGAIHTITADTDGATITFDLANSSIHNVTLSGDRTLAVSNAVTGKVFTIGFTQDAIGSRTVTWWPGISWPGGEPPALTTTADKTDRFIFICTGAGTYEGYSAAAVKGVDYLAPAGDGSALTGITAAQVGAVPTTRTVNGAALSSDVNVTDANLSTSDITANDVSTSKHGFAPKAPNDATKYLDGTGTWSAPSSSASLSYTSNTLSADVSMPSANTYYDGPSVTLSAGTWFILGTVTVYYGGAGTPFATAKLWNGTAVTSSTEMSLHISYWRTYSLTLSGIIIVPSGTQTWKISVAATAVNSSAILAACPDNGAPHASRIWAMKIAP